MRPEAKPDAAQEALKRQRTSQEIEQQNKPTLQQEQQRVQHVQQPTPEHSGANKVEGAHADAAKGQDRGRAWEDFSKKQTEHVTPAAVQAHDKIVKPENTQTAAEFQRQRDSARKA